jgi:predicted DNA-binding transcriptional regulator AlpA
MGEDEGLLTEEEAAVILQLSETTLRRLRLEGSGPPHVEIGRQTRYRQAIVQGWLAGEASAAPRQTTVSRPAFCPDPGCTGPRSVKLNR